MIQRIQTLYLFLVLVLSIISLIDTPLAKLTDNSQNSYSVTLNGIKQTNPESETIIEVSILLKLILILIPAVILLAITQFKKRKLQMNLILISALLVIGQIANEGLLIAEAIQKLKLSFQFSLGLIFPPVMLILLFLAWRGVRKDDNLVKSYERIR